jgi:8-oxo-dGTP pyrophosphatase MutT (NUDIX family)
MKVVTASAYVLLDGRFVFQVGPNKAGDRLGVVRLGGHVEPGETPLACVVREVQEEAALSVRVVPAPATYQVGPDGKLEAAVPGSWPPDETAPVLVGYRAPGEGALTYLARAEGTPVPEKGRGLLILNASDILWLMEERRTLRQYLAAGGRAVLRDPLPLDLPLEPYLHLKVLPQLLERHPHL